MGSFLPRTKLSYRPFSVLEAWVFAEGQLCPADLDSRPFQQHTKKQKHVVFYPGEILWGLVSSYPLAS